MNMIINRIKDTKEAIADIRKLLQHNIKENLDYVDEWALELDTIIDTLTILEAQLEYKIYEDIIATDK